MPKIVDATIALPQLKSLPSALMSTSNNRVHHTSARALPAKLANFDCEEDEVENGSLDLEVYRKANRELHLNVLHQGKSGKT